MKREILLEGLNCPNCAAKIEADVKNLPEVTAASLNLMKQILIMEVSKDDDLFGKVEKIVHRYEPDVGVREKSRESQDHSQELHPGKMILRMAVGAVVFVAGILLGESRLCQCSWRCILLPM